MTTPRESGVSEILFNQFFFDTISEIGVTLSALQARFSDLPHIGLVGETASPTNIITNLSP